MGIETSLVDLFEDVQVETARMSVSTAYGSTNTCTPVYTNETENTIDKLATLSNTSVTGFVITAKERIRVTMNVAGSVNGNDAWYGIIKNGSGSTLITSQDTSVVVSSVYSAGSDLAATASFSGILEVGDTLQPCSGGAGVGSSLHRSNNISVILESITGDQ